MKWIVSAMLLLVTISCAAQDDGGGRDVSVALFSAQPPRSVVVSAAGSGAWWAPCVSCKHQPLTSALHMPDVKEIVAGGPITVSDVEHKQTRTANGRWHLRAGHGNTVETVLTLPSERYVAAVLMGEAAAGEPVESLRALAVVARTFVLRPPVDKSINSKLTSDTCDSTACQAMKLVPVSGVVNKAVRSTAGETLWFQGKRAQVFFSASCGGTTEAGGAVWPVLSGLPYLRSVTDPYCIRKDHAAWHGEIPMASVHAIAIEEGWRIPADIVTAQVTERTSSQRAHTLSFGARNGQHASVSASAFRLAVGRALGWNLLRSDAYDLRVRDGVLVFDGRGYGHGVGLCQQGATKMAKLGKSYREIAAFYFPGTAVRVTSSDEGWRRTAKDGVNFASTIQLAPKLMEDAVNAWKLAKSRFPMQQQITPSITFAPTTEIFRQMTSQPGWELASTSGSVVVLQPAALIAANHVSMAATLQHEMLHVAVESSASAKTPLWLREGLVEVLAGDAASGSLSLSADETDRLLQNAVSLKASQAAHKASAVRTRQLLDRYGMSTVRAWLIEGTAIPSV